MIQLFERIKSDRLLFGAAIAAGVDLWLAIALVDIRLLVVLPLLAIGVYVANRIRGPREYTPDDVDDWY
jgi:hypothetical protein